MTPTLALYQAQNGTHSQNVVNRRTETSRSRRTRSGHESTFGNEIKLVAGGGFDLYIQHELALPIVPASLERRCETTNRPCNPRDPP
jgi:hypothetical protein